LKIKQYLTTYTKLLKYLLNCLYDIFFVSKYITCKIVFAIRTSAKKQCHDLQEKINNPVVNYN